MIFLIEKNPHNFLSNRAQLNLFVLKNAFMKKPFIIIVILIIIIINMKKNPSRFSANEAATPNSIQYVSYLLSSARTCEPFQAL